MDNYERANIVDKFKARCRDMIFLNVTPLAVEAAAEASQETAKPPAMENLVTFIINLVGEHSHLGHLLHVWENFIFTMVLVLFFVWLAGKAYKRRMKIPGRLQSAFEIYISSIDTLARDVIGHNGSKYTPFIGTLFIYILFMNFMGLLPGMHSPTSNFNTPLSLAICVFFYVQYTGIKTNGLKGYFKHLMGEPWWLFPLNLPLHILEEFIKPVSLALRLFGNIFAEDTLMAVLLILGIALFKPLPLGAPFHILFYPLAFIFSTIQALVFSMLSLAYISIMLPHEEH